MSSSPRSCVIPTEDGWCDGGPPVGDRFRLCGGVRRHPVPGPVLRHAPLHGPRGALALPHPAAWLSAAPDHVPATHQNGIEPFEQPTFGSRRPLQLRPLFGGAQRSGSCGLGPGGGGNTLTGWEGLVRGLPPTCPLWHFARKYSPHSGYWAEQRGVGGSGQVHTRFKVSPKR